MSLLSENGKITLLERIDGRFRSMTLEIRRMREEHAQFLFDWRNDKLTRENSFNSEKVIWADHLEWISKRSREQDEYHLVFFDSETPVGRFSLDSSFEVSVLVDPDSRGRGYGTRIVKGALDYLQKNGHIEALKAFIKVENTSSIRLFIAAGFYLEQENVKRNGSECVLYVYKFKE